MAMGRSFGQVELRAGGVGGVVCTPPLLRLLKLHQGDAAIPAPGLEPLGLKARKCQHDQQRHQHQGDDDFDHGVAPLRAPAQLFSMLHGQPPAHGVNRFAPAPSH